MSLYAAEEKNLKSNKCLLVHLYIPFWIYKWKTLIHNDKITYYIFCHAVYRKIQFKIWSNNCDKISLGKFYFSHMTCNYLQRFKEQRKLNERSTRCLFSKTKSSFVPSLCIPNICLFAKMPLNRLWAKTPLSFRFHAIASPLATQP